ILSLPDAGTSPRSALRRHAVEWSAHAVSPERPNPPIAEVPEYSPSPPPNVIVPPTRMPIIGSSLVPNRSNDPLYASSALTGFPSASPNRGLAGAPGCTHGYNCAVESGAPSRLKPLAVNALAAAICRLSSHWESRLGPEKATAHTTPARFTTTAQ